MLRDGNANARHAPAVLCQIDFPAGSQPVEQLVRLLIVALDGQRPVERDALDTEYFVDGSVQFRDAEVRVRLSVCLWGLPRHS
jgi:hypothetical protein